MTTPLTSLPVNEANCTALELLTAERIDADDRFHLGLDLRHVELAQVDDDREVSSAATRQRSRRVDGRAGAAWRPSVPADGAVTVKSCVRAVPLGGALRGCDLQPCERDVGRRAAATEKHCEIRTGATEFEAASETSVASGGPLNCANLASPNGSPRRGRKPGGTGPLLRASAALLGLIELELRGCHELGARRGRQLLEVAAPPRPRPAPPRPSELADRERCGS